MAVSKKKIRRLDDLDGPVNDCYIKLNAFPMMDGSTCVAYFSGAYGDGCPFTGRIQAMRQKEYAMPVNSQKAQEWCKARPWYGAEVVMIEERLF
jgi:hypothetical protein